MVSATRYECLTCKRLLISLSRKFVNVCCLLCEVLSKISDKLKFMDTRIAKLEAADISVVSEKDVGEKDRKSVNNKSVVQFNQMEDMIAKLEKT